MNIVPLPPPAPVLKLGHVLTIRSFALLIPRQLLVLSDGVVSELMMYPAYSASRFWLENGQFSVPPPVTVDCTRSVGSPLLSVHLLTLCQPMSELGAPWVPILM